MDILLHALITCLGVTNALDDGQVGRVSLQWDVQSPQTDVVEYGLGGGLGNDHITIV